MAWLCLVCAGGLLHASASAADEVVLQSPAGMDTLPAAPWRVVTLPKQRKPVTSFSVDDVEGHRSLRVEADKSYGLLLHALPAVSPTRHLSWRWHMDQLNPQVDLTHRAGDDTALRVCAAFDLPLQKVPFFERQLLRFARTRSDEYLPAAILCYVWDAHLPPGTVLPSAYTSRLRYWVLQSGDAPSGTPWPTESRDLSADFLKVFGSESSDVPPLIGVMVGADADNTQGHSLAHVSDLALRP